MPNHAVVSSMPGWMIVTAKAAQVAGLAMVARLLESPAGRPVPAAQLDEIPPSPLFITEVADRDARYHRVRVRDGSYLFIGFYSDGRVRMATPEGRRFSGIMLDRSAVMADLREDASFEVGVDRADDALTLRVDGGPYDGQTLHCETIHEYA